MNANPSIIAKLAKEKTTLCDLQKYLRLVTKLMAISFDFLSSLMAIKTKYRK